MKGVTFYAEKTYKHDQMQSQPSVEHPRPVKETTANSEESISPMEAQPISDDEWDPSMKFSAMLTRVAKQLNQSADVEDLKDFLSFLCHPRTCQRYIDIKLYEHCRTPREIIKALVPQYIHYMHTHLLKQIVEEFGNEQSQTLLKQYEDNFPRKKYLKRMRDPIPDEEVCSATKKIKVKFDGDFNNTTIADVEKVQRIISRNTGIDASMIVYANQIPGCVIFTFLIPETVVSAFINLDADNQSDLGGNGILRIESHDLVIDLQSSHPKTKTALCTYTTSGMKRVPLTHDSLEASHCNTEFQQLISKVGTSLAESVETIKLKEFLQSFSHILYPESQYIDPWFLKDTASIHRMFTALQPQIMNFLNWGLLWKAIDAFDVEVMPAFKSYTNRFPHHTKLSTLIDPLSEEDISDFKGFQKLRVTCVGGSGIEWMLGDIQAVREAVEKATGIDQDFIIYAYWEGGFTMHQFTFLIPKSVSGIFGELCKEDLTILAGVGVQRLEVDYDTVAENIQELYEECPQPVAPVRAHNGMSTKNFGLENFIPEDKVEKMSKEEFNHLNDLIISTPAGKLQETCSDVFLKDFAKQIGNWKDLAPFLGINEWDLKKLAKTYPLDEDKQKHRALVCWKEIDVNSATYERLVECLLTHGHIDDAKELLLHFQGQQQHFV